MADHTLKERVPYGKRGEGSLALFDDSPYWQSCYSIRGVEHRESTEQTDIKLAKKFHKAKLDEKVNDRTGHKAFVAPATKRVTVDTLLDNYLADLKLRKARSLDRITSAAKPIRAAFGAHRAIEITSAQVDKYIEKKLAAEKQPTTINRGTQLLASAFKLAVKHRTVIEAPSIRRLPEPNVRGGFFEADELTRVIEHLPDYLVPLVRFAYLTGWRRGEIVGLRWEWVNMRAQTITLPGTQSKNGKARTIHIDGDLLALLQAQERGRLVTRRDGKLMLADHVFHRSGMCVGDFKTAWLSALAKGDLTGKIFHDFRRTAVRNMVARGIPETTAMSISGHRTRAMFDRYSIVSGKDQRAAFKVLSAR